MIEFKWIFSGVIMLTSSKNLTRIKLLQIIFYPNPYLQIRLHGVVAPASSGRLFYITNYTNSSDKLQFIMKRRYLIWQAEIGL